MLALVLIGLGATLLYLSNQNQQLLAKPIAFHFALAGAAILSVSGFIALYEHTFFWVAVFQSIAMISIIFMILPVLGGFYASSSLHQSSSLKSTIVDISCDIREELAGVQKYH